MNIEDAVSVAVVLFFVGLAILCWYTRGMWKKL